MVRSKSPTETVPVTLRIKSELLARYRALAAKVTIQQGGDSMVTAQDLMRECLEHNPAVKLCDKGTRRES